MKNKLKCVMLIDDNPDDNFFHERVIRNNKFTDCVIVKESAIDALKYIKTKEHNHSNEIDVIFLDINMPGMNGWDFLEEYSKLDQNIQSQVIIIMLTTSDNPDDKLKSEKWSFTKDFKTKPLTKQMMEDIIKKYIV